MLTAEEAIEKFREFESRANAKRDRQINRIKEDRTFLSGSQWAKEDDLFDPAIPRRTVNVLANSINATANVYASYPYKWYCRAEEADMACDAFLKYGSNARAAYDALYGSVAFGLGFIAIGSEQVADESGNVEEIPALYCVDKQENVYFDPDSVEMDGRDAIEAAIIECKSKTWVKSKYGEKWVTDKGVRAVVNVAANKDPETMVFVTYFRIEDDRCVVYRLLNNDFIDQPVVLNISRVPVFPVYGERSWDNDDIVWQGLVRKGSAIQKLINYGFTQLSARMAQAPKTGILTSGDVIEGYSEGYRNYMYNANPVLLYNRTSDDGKTEFKPPERFDCSVKFDDITGIIGAQLELLSTITGVDAKGVMQGETPVKTATEVITSERQTQCTIRHYYANLRDSFKSVGETVLQLLGYGKVNVDVIQGPADAMQLQVARQELMQLMALVPDDKRMQLVNGIFLSHPDNAVLRNVFGAINMNPGPSPLEQQAFATVDAMKQAIGQKDMQIQDLQEQIKRLEAINRDNDKSTKAEFAKAAMEHKFKQDDMILQAQLDNGLDADKAAMENAKSRMELEKEAIQLDTAKMKATSDMFKAFGQNRGEQ